MLIKPKQIDFTAFTGFPTPDRNNKAMTASVTVADGDVACATTIAQTPSSSSTNGGYIGVNVNGAAQFVGDGTKASVDCYFSGDGGTTARALRAVVTGDLLYWNGSIAGFQLAVTDKVSFLYATTG